MAQDYKLYFIYIYTYIEYRREIYPPTWTFNSNSKNSSERRTRGGGWGENERKSDLNIGRRFKGNIFKIVKTVINTKKMLAEVVLVLLFFFLGRLLEYQRRPRSRPLRHDHSLRERRGRAPSQTE